jgi:hypothetical protein
MAPIPLLLMVFAFVCFVGAAYPPAPVEPWRTRLIAAGLAFWSLVLVLGYSGVMPR